VISGLSPEFHRPHRVSTWEPYERSFPTSLDQIVSCVSTVEMASLRSFTRLPASSTFPTVATSSYFAARAYSASAPRLADGHGIQRVGVVGAGQMGLGIALVTARVSLAFFTSMLRKLKELSPVRQAGCISH
jgi:hypothetical protein